MLMIVDGQIRLTVINRVGCVKNSQYYSGTTYQPQLVRADFNYQKYQLIPFDSMFPSIVKSFKGKGQGTWNYPFGGNQTMQLYGHFEGFSL